MRLAAPLVLLLVGAFAACAAFDGDDGDEATPDPSSSDGGEGEAGDAGDDGATTPPTEDGPVACFACPASGDCQSFSAAELCANGHAGWMLDRDPGNPDVDCSGDRFVMKSPSTLDTSLSRTFDVDQVETATTGLRIAVAGRGVVGRIGSLSLIAANGPADMTLLQLCPIVSGPNAERCVELLQYPAEGDPTLHDLVVQISYPRRPDAGNVVTHGVTFDCQVKGKTTAAGNPTSLEISLGPMNTAEVPATVAVAHISVARQF